MAGLISIDAASAWQVGNGWFDTIIAATLFKNLDEREHTTLARVLHEELGTYASQLWSERYPLQIGGGIRYIAFGDFAKPDQIAFRRAIELTLQDFRDGTVHPKVPWSIERWLLYLDACADLLAKLDRAVGSQD